MSPFWRKLISYKKLNESYDDFNIFEVMVRLETNMPVELRITKMTFLLETDDTVETVAVKLKNRPRSQLRNRYQGRTVHFSIDFTCIKPGKPV